MANCPKCNEHLGLKDWRQHCPHCGANIVVYDLQERLMQEADVAEVQYYHFQKRIDRVKASFIGTKLAIARIVTSLIPVGALFLPLVKAAAKAPFKDFSGGISALTIYNSVDQFNDEVLNALFAAENKIPSMFLIASAVLLVLSILLTVLHLIFLTLSCSPKGKPRNMAFDILILLTSIGSAVAFAAMPDGGLITNGSLFVGAFLYIALQIVNVVIDFLTIKQGIPVHHKQCFVGGIPIEEYFEMEKTMSREQIREEQYRRLQAIQDENEAKLKAAEEEKAKEAAAHG